MRRVLLLLPYSPAFVASFFGAIKIGAVPVPVDADAATMNMDLAQVEAAVDGVDDGRWRSPAMI